MPHAFQLCGSTGAYARWWANRMWLFGGEINLITQFLGVGFASYEDLKSRDRPPGTRHRAVLPTGRPGLTAEEAPQALFLPAFVEALAGHYGWSEPPYSASRARPAPPGFFDRVDGGVMDRLKSDLQVHRRRRAGFRDAGGHALRPRSLTLGWLRLRRRRSDLQALDHEVQAAAACVLW